MSEKELNPDLNPDIPKKEEPKIEELSKEEALLKELNEYKDKYLRTLAELENSRKRLVKEKEEAIRFAIDRTIGEFIFGLENFENALKFAKSSSDEVQKWAVGFQMILTEFKEILHAHGIVAFHCVGSHFDPAAHEVMEIVETEEFPDNTVIEEFSKGYKSGSRVIRPARVKIARKPGKQELEN